MSKRFVISEQERKDIKKMYNVKEGFFDDAIDFIKDKGEDLVDYFSDVIGIDDKEEELTASEIKNKLKNDNLTDEEIKKLEKKLEDSDYSVSKSDVGENGMSPSNLFDSIDSKMNNESLSFALVANAFGESGFNCAANGDGGSYAQDKSESIKVGDKKYCSFGLWQFNICGGLGIKYLKDYGYENKSPKEKYELLTDCKSQIDFMCEHIKQKISKMSQKEKNKSVNEWVEWIVYNIEKPSDKVGATKRRQNWAMKNINDSKYNISKEVIKNLA